MAIKIPVAQRQVQADVAQIATPETVRPLRASFGEDVAQANQQIADTGTKIAGMIQKHAEKKAKIERDTAEEKMITAFNSENHEKLFSTNLVTITDANGEEHQIQEGYMNRANADGTGEEYDEWSATRINDYVANIQDPEAQVKVAGRLNSIYMNGRNNVYKNESVNWRKRQDAEIEASKQVQIDEAVGAQDPASIERAMTSMEDTQRKQNFSDGLGPEASKLAIQKSNGDILESALSGALTKDASGLTARGLLESQKDKIGKERAIKLDKSIDSAVKANSTILLADLNEAFLNDELTVEDVMGAAHDKTLGGIGGTSAKGLISNLKTKLKQDIKPFEKKGVAKGYLKAVDKYLDTDLEELQAQQILVDAYAQTLTKDEKNLLQSIRKNLKKNKDNVTSTRFQDSLRSIDQSMKIKGGGDEALQRALGRMMVYNQELDKTEEEINIYKNEILKQEQVKLTPSAAKYTDGETIVRAGRTFKVIFVEGKPTFEQVK